MGGDSRGPPGTAQHVALYACSPRQLYSVGASSANRCVSLEDRRLGESQVQRRGAADLLFTSTFVRAGEVQRKGKGERWVAMEVRLETPRHYVQHWVSRTFCLPLRLTSRRSCPVLNFTKAWGGKRRKDTTPDMVAGKTREPQYQKETNQG